MEDGWNLIGNPYLFPIPFGNLRLLKDNQSYRLDSAEVQASVKPKFWKWQDATPNDVTDGVYEAIGKLNEAWHPWTGYWIHTNSQVTVEFLPYIDLTSAAPVMSVPELTWQATIQLGNQRGVSSVSLALSRNYSVVEQPPLPSQTRISLFQGKERLQQLVLLKDADEWVWQAELIAAENSVLELEGPPLPGYQLYVEYPSRGLRQLIDPETRISIETGEDSVRFRMTRQHLGVDLLDVRPSSTRLRPNYPNPFNPETWIPFQLAVSGEIQLTIYNVEGQVVRQLNLGFHQPGYYRQMDRAAYWDGKDDLGQSVSSGLYFYQLQVGEVRDTRKMVILK